MTELKTIALFLPDLKSLLTKRDFVAVKSILSEINPIDIAEGWSSLTPQERVLVFNLLTTERAVEVFEELDFGDQLFLLNILENSALGPVIGELSLAEKARIFHRLSPKTIRKLFGLMKREEVEETTQVLSYPAGSAGSLMSTDLILLHPEMNARQALEKVQNTARLRKSAELKRFQTLYITDTERHLLGWISLPALISAPADIKLCDILYPAQVIKIRYDTDQELVARHFSKYNLLSAPVVNEENRLLGMITFDEVFDVINEEVNEDIARMAGTEVEELTDRTIPIPRVVRLRMPWLLASWFGGMVASVIIGYFQNTLSQMVSLAAFMPVISGMGGNVGGQSATIVVRGLATGKIKLEEVGRILIREMRVGFFLGLIYGVLLGVASYFTTRQFYSFFFPLVVGTGICISMTVAATLGALLPVVFKKVGIDPAVATQPFVQTLTDILSITAYFTLATVVLF